MSAWLLASAMIVSLPACDRENEFDPVYPNPDVGFSETESVGKRGTEVGGFFDRNLPRSKARDESHRGVPTELARAVQAMGSRVISDEAYDWRASPPPPEGTAPAAAPGGAPEPGGVRAPAPLR